MFLAIPRVNFSISPFISSFFLASRGRMVELLWAIATPLVWLCQLLWYALARPWAAALVIALISTVFLVYRHRKNAGHQVCFTVSAHSIKLGGGGVKIAVLSVNMYNSV